MKRKKLLANQTEQSVQVNPKEQSKGYQRDTYSSSDLWLNNNTSVYKQLKKFYLRFNHLSIVKHLTLIINKLYNKYYIN